MADVTPLDLVQPPRPDNRGEAVAGSALGRLLVALFAEQGVQLARPVIARPVPTADEFGLVFGHDDVPLVALALPAPVVAQIVANLFGGAPALPVCGQLPDLLLSRLGAQLLSALVALVGHELKALPAELRAPPSADWLALGFPLVGDKAGATVELRLDPRLLPNRGGLGAGTNSADWRAELEAAVLSAALPVRAVLTEEHLTLQRLARLAPGDIIPLVPPAFVQLLAGGRPVARATVGESNSRVAVRIDHVFGKVLH